MAYFRTEKVRSRVNVFDAATGEYLCQLTAKEAPGWIARAEHRRAEDDKHAEADAAQSRAYRLATARAYMVRRCYREMARGRQLSFAF